MESFNKLTETQLLHEINKAKDNHESLKKEIVGITLDIEEKEKVVNDLLIKLENIERNYVGLIKEMTERTV